MKLTALLLLLLCPPALTAQGKTVCTVDPAASALKWTGHAELGTYAPSGTLALREGQVLLLDGAFAGANLVIDMASMTQDNKDLLHHLKSADFFDVEHFPTATIKIDRVEKGTVFGTMTVKGKTAPIQSPVTVAEAGNRFTITGKVTLDRTAYGIVYNSASFFSGLGNQAIRNTFEVEFTLTGTGNIPQKYRS